MAQTEIYTRERPLPGLWRYSLIRKAAMALSGIALVLFLFGHWNGNRALLHGESSFNGYLVWLQQQPILHYWVWGVLNAALLVHLAVALPHWLGNRRARPVRYHRSRHQATSWAARTMILSGAILLLFILLHIAQIRGWLVFDDGGVYRNLQAGFDHGWVLALYLLAQISLALHLYHGLWSLFQTLGINDPRYNHWRRPIAAVLGLLIAALNIGLILLNLEPVKQLLGAFA